jgi:hypothetical protein
MRTIIRIFALTTTLFLVGVNLNAATVAVPQQDSAQMQPPQQAQSDADKTSVFTGKVMEAKGQLVLMDTATKATYVLDDQEKAKPFKGKTVKVTGTLEAASNTIHISNIEPA